MNMNASVRPLLRGKYSSGTYTVVSGLQGKDELIEWIQRGEFRNFEQDQFKISFLYSSRNTIYAFFLPYHPTKLVMKKATVNPRSLLLRRIQVWFRCLLGIYARRAFVGSCLLHDARISTPRPLAYWTFRHGWKKWFITDNYFLYEYQNGEAIVDIRGQAIRGDGQYQYIDQLHCKMATFIKQLHIAGLRHGNAYAGNFLVSAPQETEDLPDMKLASLCLLDNDSFGRVYIRVPAVKHFFDFLDLAKAVPSRYAIDPPLRVYLGREPTGYDRWLLRFWQGGTRIRRRLRRRIMKRIMKWCKQRKKRKHGRD